MELFTAEQSRRLDSGTILGHGVPSLELMENAAMALAGEAERQARGSSAAVFFGSGNNGGDGAAAARILAGKGWSVRAFFVGKREKLTPDCGEMVRRMENAGVCAETDWSGAEADEFLRGCGVIIDALLGTGLNSAVRGAYADAIELINSLTAPVVSADIPSGVSADSGTVMGTAVRADATVTFGFPKIGLFVEPGCVYAGKLTVADIGILPDREIFSGCKTFAYTGGEARAAIPPRSPLSHKGSYGKLLVIGGCVGYTGAPYLASQAAVHSGVGLVFLAVPDSIYEIEAVKCTEAMPFPLPSTKDGRIDGLAGGTVRKISEKLEGCNVCLAGPGMGRGEESTTLIKYLLENYTCTLILDADGINALSGTIDILDRAACHVVLTPHEMEFRRLGGDIGDNRLEAARDFARRYGCTLVLKGHRSITALTDGRCFVNTCGNSGMAKGGSGDVLSGITAALCAQLEPEEAVPLAVYLHSRAGDLAAERYGEYSMTPGDIISLLPEAFSGS